jgi:hypothetical protein
MIVRAYASPQGFRQALEQRLKTASNSGVDFPRRPAAPGLGPILGASRSCLRGHRSSEGWARARAPPGTRSRHQGRRSAAMVRLSFDHFGTAQATDLLPEANELVVQILAAVAQAERKAISERGRGQNRTADTQIFSPPNPAPSTQRNPPSPKTAY